MVQSIFHLELRSDHGEKSLPSVWGGQLYEGDRVVRKCMIIYSFFSRKTVADCFASELKTHLLVICTASCLEEKVRT